MNRCGTWYGIKSVALVVAVIVALAVGCGTSMDVDKAREQTRTVITLTAETYDVVMTSLGALYKTRVIGNTERDLAVGYANQFRAAAL